MQGGRRRGRRKKRSDVAFSSHRHTRSRLGNLAKKKLQGGSRSAALTLKMPRNKNTPSNDDNDDYHKKCLMGVLRLITSPCLPCIPMCGNSRLCGRKKRDPDDPHEKVADIKDDALLHWRRNSSDGSLDFHDVKGVGKHAPFHVINIQHEPGPMTIGCPVRGPGSPVSATGQPLMYRSLSVQNGDTPVETHLSLSKSENGGMHRQTSVKTAGTPPVSSGRPWSESGDPVGVLRQTSFKGAVSQPSVWTGEGRLSSVKGASSQSSVYHQQGKTSVKNASSQPEVFSKTGAGDNGAIQRQASVTITSSHPNVSRAGSSSHDDTQKRRFHDAVVRMAGSQTVVFVRTQSRIRHVSGGSIKNAISQPEVFSNGAQSAAHRHRCHSMNSGTRSHSSTIKVASAAVATTKITTTATSTNSTSSVSSAKVAASATTTGGEQKSSPPGFSPTKGILRNSNSAGSADAAASPASPTSRFTVTRYVESTEPGAGDGGTNVVPVHPSGHFNAVGSHFVEIHPQPNKEPTNALKEPIKSKVDKESTEQGRTASTKRVCFGKAANTDDMAMDWDWDFPEDQTNQSVPASHKPTGDKTVNSSAVISVSSALMCILEARISDKSAEISVTSAQAPETKWSEAAQRSLASHDSSKTPSDQTANP